MNGFTTRTQAGKMVEPAAHTFLGVQNLWARNNRNPWRGYAGYGGRQISTTYYATAEEAARAVDRFLYKLGKATNFPVSAEAAAELDALSIEEVESQFRQEGAAGGVFSTGVSKFRGVSCAKGSTKCQATIFGSKNHNLGYYEKQEDAALAYDAGSFILRGRQAKLNFPERMAGFSDEQARAQAVEILGLDKVQRLEAAKKGVKQPAAKGASKGKQAFGAPQQPGKRKAPRATPAGAAAGGPSGAAGGAHTSASEGEGSEGTDGGDGQELGQEEGTAGGSGSAGFESDSGLVAPDSEDWEQGSAWDGWSDDLLDSEEEQHNLLEAQLTQAGLHCVDQLALQMQPAWEDYALSPDTAAHQSTHPGITAAEAAAAAAGGGGSAEAAAPGGATAGAQQRGPSTDVCIEQEVQAFERLLRMEQDKPGVEAGGSAGKATPVDDFEAWAQRVQQGTEPLGPHCFQDMSTSVKDMTVVQKLYRALELQQQGRLSPEKMMEALQGLRDPADRHPTDYLRRMAAKRVPTTAATTPSATPSSSQGGASSSSPSSSSASSQQSPAKPSGGASSGGGSGSKYSSKGSRGGGGGKSAKKGTSAKKRAAKSGGSQGGGGSQSGCGKDGGAKEGDSGLKGPGAQVMSAEDFDYLVDAGITSEQVMELWDHYCDSAIATMTAAGQPLPAKGPLAAPAPALPCPPQFHALLGCEGAWEAAQKAALDASVEADEDGDPALRPGSDTFDPLHRQTFLHAYATAWMQVATKLFTGLCVPQHEMLRQQQAWLEDITRRVNALPPLPDDTEVGGGGGSSSAAQARAAQLEAIVREVHMSEPELTAWLQELEDERRNGNVVVINAPW